MPNIKKNENNLAIKALLFKFPPNNWKKNYSTN